MQNKIVIRGCSECPFLHYSPGGLLNCALGNINLTDKAKYDKRFPKECPISGSLSIEIEPSKFCYDCNFLNKEGRYCRLYQ